MRLINTKYIHTYIHCLLLAISLTVEGMTALIDRRVLAGSPVRMVLPLSSLEMTRA